MDEHWDGPIRGFRDLRIWQAGMDLVEQVYRLTSGFPQHEIYGLTSQLRRAVVSVPSNIAEGHTKEGTAEFLRFLSIAQGSLAELQTQLEIAVRLGYCSVAEVEPLLNQSGSLARQLFTLRNRLATRLTSNSHSTPKPQAPTPNPQ